MTPTNSHIHIIYESEKKISKIDLYKNSCPRGQDLFSLFSLCIFFFVRRMSQKRRVVECAPETKEIAITQFKLLSKLQGEDRWGVIQENESLLNALTELELEEQPNDKLKRKSAMKKIDKFMSWYADIRAEADKFLNNPAVSSASTAPQLDVLEHGSIDELNAQMNALANQHRVAHAESLRSYVLLLRQFAHWQSATKKALKATGLAEKDCVARMREACLSLFGLNYTTLLGNKSRILSIVDLYPLLMYAGADKSSIKEYAGSFKLYLERNIQEEYFWSNSIPAVTTTPATPEALIDLLGSFVSQFIEDEHLFTMCEIFVAVQHDADFMLATTPDININVVDQNVTVQVVTSTPCDTGPHAELIIWTVTVSRTVGFSYFHLVISTQEMQPLITPSTEQFNVFVAPNKTTFDFVARPDQPIEMN